MLNNAAKLNFDAERLSRLAKGPLAHQLHQAIVDSGGMFLEYGESLGWELVRTDKVMPAPLNDPLPYTLNTVASAKDGALTVSIDDRYHQCHVQYDLPVAKIGADAELMFKFYLTSINVPACQEAAAFFNYLDLDVLKTTIPEVADQSKWLPYYQGS